MVLKQMENMAKKSIDEYFEAGEKFEEESGRDKIGHLIDLWKTPGP